MTNPVVTENYTLYLGNCLEVLKGISDNSIDSIITDPPAGIGFMNKSWDSDKGGRNFWISWMEQIASECLRVLKPGGHALVWSIPRTSHWTATAWENSGFEIRDRIIHCFGSGFPKNLDIGKQIEKKYGKNEIENYYGFGTALKPAVEDWWLCRKPIEGTVVENVLKYGTGGINIDECRISTQDSLGGGMVSKGRPKVREGWDRPWMHDENITNEKKIESASKVKHAENLGRYPANLIHDGSEEVLSLFPNSNGSGQSRTLNRNAKPEQEGWGMNKHKSDVVQLPDAGKGSASRFFYSAKASKKDREEGLENFEESDSTIQNTSRRFNPICDNTGERIQNCSCGNCTWSKDTNPLRKNHHPTVKPVELMKYLCRLITPINGIILDPFMGSGSTGKAAMLENFRFVGIEKESEYFEIAKARIEYVVKNNRGLMEFLENK